MTGSGMNQMHCPKLGELPSPPPGKTGWPWTEESTPIPDRLPDGRPWPRVTIVTPSFNQGQFIEETIRSVLLQGYPNLEYIIMDGGSTDGSLEIIRKYQTWLAGWVSKPDRGQTQAINQGWSQATGEILAYINSDDCYLAGGVAQAVWGFQNNPYAGMVYAAAVIVDAEGKELKNWDAMPFDLKVMLTEENVVPQPAAFFSRDVLNQLGYLDEKYQMIMDYELYIRLGMGFSSICLPGKLARFRDHPGSKTRTRFETTAQELIRFGNAFFNEHPSRSDMQALRPATLGRYYYMLALGCVAQGRGRAARALKPLIRSISLYPPFALRRPLQTSYVVKEALLGYLSDGRDLFVRKTG